ncbi:alpha/beta hydrolase fold protein [Calothrix parasitica NIES-267]|uniref:Alpha/beta hydrolase fold protein n=1 Tax=Calothrix parasitica NIES-267 TaxID=1973488 RepID=A0A1Z4LM95_9CYAN|nr:alpha/beta hydrolase fold protein [Calothrix parasitica NIES-267]
MLWLFAVLIGLICFGIISQIFLTKYELNKFPPPGKLIDIDGKSLHYKVMGEGNPTVVIDNGQGGTHLDWQLVQPEIAKLTRTVTYDRAGYGWSNLSSSQKPRTAEQCLDELRQLLQKAKIPPPYILVGMSLSGLFVRLFAYQYPEEVAGMVLVDVTHEQMYERIPPKMVKLNQKVDWFAINILPIAARIGLFRLFVIFDKLPLATDLFKKLPQEIQSSAKSIYAQTKFWQAFGRESAAHNVALEQLKQVRNTKSFPDIPLIVLSSGKKDFGATEELLQAIHELHADLAEESPQGIQIIANDSGHAIQLDEPKLVVDAIRQVVEKVRCK